jgi:putative glycosyltransferase
MDLSVVTTMYDSAPYLEEFYRRIVASVKAMTDDYEIIFVNDGSPDPSLNVALSLYERDERVRVIDLSRNFGHHKAMMTGLSHSLGQLVFLIDCDLEEEPEMLPRFHQEMTATHADVVYGVQETRSGGFFKRFTGHFFYTLFNILSSYPVPRNAITARLMSRRYVTNLVAHKDREVFLLGLWAITGFKQAPVAVQKHFKGDSTYTLRRRVSVFINSITSFSNRPLVFIFYLGCAISLLSGIAAFYLIARRLFFGVLLQGWPSLIVSIWLLGGLTIFCLGIIGIYLSRIFTETKQRPYTIIRQIYERIKNEPG